MQRTKGFGLIAATMIISVAGAGLSAYAFAGQTTRVSVSSAGIPANTGATTSVLSADGRYVVFQSSASNLVTGVSGTHVYRHDRTTVTTVLVDLSTTDGASAGQSAQPTVSANGRFVAFSSTGSDLVVGDSNGLPDVFVRDMQAGTTALVSASSTGVVGDRLSGLSGLSGAHEISDDGRYVVFTSTATNFVAGANASQQVYVKDTTTGAVVRASVNDAGEAGNNNSFTAAISGDGHVVAFQSASTNFSSSSNSAQVFVRALPAGPTTLESAGAAAVALSSTVPTLSFDGRYLAFVTAAHLDPRDADNGNPDVFLRDRVAGTTVLASRSPNLANGVPSGSPSISADGRWVGFQSLDDMLVVGDVGGLTDVFLYDRDTQALTLVSRNDAGEQANKPSFGPSVSSDGHFVLFGSTASNLVASASNAGTNQLYLRCTSTNTALCSLVSNSAPVVNAGADETVTAGTWLNRTGSFSDADESASWTATVDYGTGAVLLPLAGDKTFWFTHAPVTPGTYVVTVSVTDDGGATGLDTFSFTVTTVTYSIEWLSPVSDTFTVGRNLPVKFAVRGPDGSPVLDRSVQVDVVDSSGVVIGPYFFGDQPSRSVVWNGASYHVNVNTKDLEPGMYWLRVRFALTGEFSLATTGTTSAVRSRLRD